MSVKSNPAQPRLLASSHSEPFRLFFQRHPTPMWVYDLKTLAFLEVNDAAVENYGYSREEFLRMTLKDIRPAEEVSRLQKDVKQKRPTLQHSGEWKHQLRNGRVIDVEITSHTLEYNGRKAALVTAQDVTERNLVQESMRAITNRQEALLIAIPDIIMEVDTNKVYTWANPAGIEFFGEDVIGKRADCYFEGEQDVYEQVEPLFNGTKDLTYVESWQRRRDGETRLLGWHCRTLKDTKGIVIGVLSSAHDITERKLAETALRESQERFAALFHSNPAAVAITRLSDNRFVDVNPSWQELTGYSRDEAIEHSPLELNLWADPAQRARLIEAVQKSGKTRTVIQIRERTGEIHELLLSAEVVHLAGEHYLITMAQDLTEQIQVETELRASEERYRDLVENISDLICMHDLHGNLLSVNHAATELTGYSMDELIGRNLRDFMLPENQRPFDEYLSLIRKERRASGLMSILTKNGQKRIWEFHNTLRAEGVSEPVVRGYARDITERRRAEKELYERETRYRSLFEDSPISLWEEDFSAVKQRLDGLKVKGVTDFRAYFSSRPQEVAECISLVKVLDVNKATLDLYEASSKEKLIGNLGQVFIGVTNEDFIEELLYMAAGLTDFAWTGVNRTLNGKQIDVNLRWSVVPGYEQTLERVIVSLVDITERKQAEEALLQSKQHLCGVLDNSPDTIYAIDLHSNQVTFLNREEFCGYSRDEFGAPGSLLHKLHPDDRAIVEKHWQQCVLLGSPNPIEYRLQTKDGKWEWIRQRTNILTRDTDGAPRQLLITLTNITEHKRMEAERITLQDMIERSRNELYVFDAETLRFQYVNGGALRNLGYSLEQMLTFTPLDIKHEFTEASFRTLIQPLLRHETERLAFETVHYRADGSVYPVEIFLQLILTGEQELFLAVINDITYRKEAERNLRESENRFRALIENSSDMITLVDAQGKVIFHTPSHVAILGYVREAGKESFLEHVFPDDRPSLEDALDTVRHNPGIIVPILSRFIRQDGKVIWLEGTAMNALEDEAVGAIVINYRNVTERIQAQLALQESESKYRTLIEQIPAVVYLDLLDGKGTTLFVSPQVETILGVPVREWMEQDASIWLDLIHPEDRQEALHAYHDLTTVEQGYEIEYRMVPKDGAIIWIHDKGIVRQNENGELLLQGVMYDITEQKQAENALRESEARFRGYFELPLVGFAITSPTTQWIDANPALCKMFGYTKEELIQKNWKEITHPDDLSANMEKFNRALRGEIDNYSLGKRFIRKDGSIIYVDMAVHCLRHPDRTINYLMSLFLDVTEHKQAEEKIRQMNVELEQRVTERTRELRETQEQLIRQEKLAVLGQLASGVGHELRNPLAIINNAVYFLKLVQPEANQKIQDYHAIIEKETRTAEKIITDLLDFARIKSVDREAVTVSDLVARVLERFPAPPPVTVLLNIPADLPRLFVDVRQMEQVLGNLVTNACQAMPEGGRLSVTGDQTSVNSEVWVRIAVRDMGVGIPPENMKKLFEPLFTTKVKGIGLGLAVSKKLAEANGGRIEVESEVGVGSTFTLWLPIQQERSL